MWKTPRTASGKASSDQRQVKKESEKISIQRVSFFPPFLLHFHPLRCGVLALQSIRLWSLAAFISKVCPCVSTKEFLQGLNFNCLAFFFSVIKWRNCHQTVLDTIVPLNNQGDEPFRTAV